MAEIVRVTTEWDLENGVASIITSKIKDYEIVTSIITPITTLLIDDYRVITELAVSYFFAGTLVTVLDIPTNYTSLAGTVTSIVEGEPYTVITTLTASSSTGSGSGSGSAGGGGAIGGGGGGHPLPSYAPRAPVSGGRVRYRGRRRKIPVAR